MTTIWPWPTRPGSHSATVDQLGRTYFEKASRTVAYLSAEFLSSPTGQNLVNLGIMGPPGRPWTSSAFHSTLAGTGRGAGLGNGGLGRLAACYLDSLAALEIPAIGYGIRYEFGIFDQEIHDGWQVEVLDRWLRLAIVGDRAPRDSRPGQAGRPHRGIHRRDRPLPCALAA